MATVSQFRTPYIVYDLSVSGPKSRGIPFARERHMTGDRHDHEPDVTFDDVARMDSNNLSGHLFWHAAVQWQRAVNEALAPFNVTYLQLMVITQAWVMWQESGQLPSQRELADRAGWQGAPSKADAGVERRLLFDAVGATTQASCYHHQRVLRLGDGLEPVAYATDGSVEAMVKTDAPGWFLAVQWHPEDTFGTDPAWYECVGDLRKFGWSDEEASAIPRGIRCPIHLAYGDTAMGGFVWLHSILHTRRRKNGCASRSISLIFFMNCSKTGPGPLGWKLTTTRWLPRRSGSCARPSRTCSGVGSPVDGACFFERGNNCRGRPRGRHHDRRARARPAVQR